MLFFDDGAVFDIADGDVRINIPQYIQIEEVSNIIEEVVLIDKGKILVQETVEELLEKGYSVSGAAQEVDHYCVGRNVIGYDELGGLKVAYILGEKTVLPQESNLQITAMNLQKLFVKMTEKGGGEND